MTTLAITDHDTFAGYDQAVEPARRAGIELICGIELATKLEEQSVHLLGYFRDGAPREFRDWILGQQATRRDRNRRLAARLRELGVDITLEEVEARGRGLTGRPHFAQILVEKGYVQSLQQAFDDYLDTEAKAYVDRKEPLLTDAIARIARAGGVASLAHPIRIKGDLASILPPLRNSGLRAIEAYHSDHSAELSESFLRLAEKNQLRVTGGSDFHGTVKPAIKLGTGRNGNLRLGGEIVEQMWLPV